MSGMKKNVSEEWFIEGDEAPLPVDDAVAASSANLTSASNSSTKLGSSPQNQSVQSRTSRINLSRSQSQELKQITIQSTGAQSMLKGITSSPSFQELEKAIGAQLAMSLTPDEVAGVSGGKKGARGPHSSQGYYNANTNHHRAFYNQQPPEPLVTPEEKVARTRKELMPFVDEGESRALILFHSPSVPAATIKNVCQKNGVLNYFRQEFHSRGATFLCYFDIRHAAIAFSSISDEVAVEARYSAPLQHTQAMGNAAKASEESILTTSGIPDILDAWNKSSVESVFSRYGRIKTITKLDKSIDDAEGTASYSIEYFNTQDARLAAAELTASSTEIWGSDSSVKIGFVPMDEAKKQLGIQLLAILSRWRVEQGQQRAHDVNRGVFAANPYGSYPAPPRAQHIMPMSFYPYDTTGIYVDAAGVPMQYPTYGMPMQMQVSMYGQMYYPPQAMGAEGVGGMTMNFVHGGNDAAAAGPYSSGGLMPYHTGYDMGHMYAGGQPFQRVGVHSHDWPSAQRTGGLRSVADAAVMSASRGHPLSSAPDTRPIHHTNSGGSRIARPGGEGSGAMSSEFTLNIGQLARGDDTRTTLMVRNIPNKYSQLMLLEEINVKHAGKYDFFYLPIDFKNKCNVGYCFINFLEAKFILPFVTEFNGQGWKSFNSEKVCAVSFARIQGKAAMISRFQNSSLLDKDDEYRPLLFYSSGALKGRPEPFPLATKNSSRFDDQSVSDKP